jgi:hypothetical protein
MKRGVVVSDIHAGSIYGLLPPGFITFEGVEKKLNIGQQYLWECWEDFCERVRTFKPDFVIANGDLIDGPQKKNHGSELSLITPGDQAKAAVETLRHLRKATGSAPKWYFTQGTPYHVGNFGDAEEEIAHQCAAEKYSSVGTGKYCREVLWLKTEGVIIEAAHHVSGTTGFYRLTGIDREMQWSAMAGKDDLKGVPKSDLLVRSHLHHFVSGEHASKQGIITPCWQLQTRYARKHSVSRLLPDIGGILLTVDGEAKKRGEAPVAITKELYRLPQIRLTELA